MLLIKTGYGDQNVAMVDAQRAYIMSIILQANLDRKLPQRNIANEPSIVKETLSDEKKQGQDLIKALNDNEMPIPEFYRNMLGIKEWQAGMTLFYQKLPEEVKDLPTEQSPELIEAFETIFLNKITWKKKTILISKKTALLI